jgi:hypothetical protein
MINTVEQLGRNAGRVWETLNQYGSLTITQLIELTTLRPYEVYIAVGWLARENKIRKNNNIFHLDETNLTAEIGGNAGKLWKILEEEGEKNISYLSQCIQLETKDTFSAIGWLARENKIQLSKQDH